MTAQIQQAKEAFGARLREIREDANLLGRQLAEAAGWQPSKVTRIERGTRNASEDDLRAWCRICGAQEQLADLIATRRNIESAYVEWQRQLRVGLRRRQEASVPLYEQASLFRVYHPFLIPGLLQTPGYAAAVMRQVRLFLSLPDDVDDAVEARMDRQRVLYRGDRRFMFVIEEQALRTRVGDPDVMAGQFDRLISSMSLQRVSLGIIPAGASREIWPAEGFLMFDDLTVRVETVSAQLTITQPREIALYGRTFERMQAIAAYGGQARELILEAAAAI
ncbi:helix-turn-helix domain-containing protein [Nonomuraea sp. NPDC050790]|uniref:helix-turn-helix domain-containing protein n=1 Tax=Nonomuraea sp. NPDC050790 TaxID=3364371 RepID=UPI0037AD1E9E